MKLSRNNRRSWVRTVGDVVLVEGGIVMLFLLSLTFMQLRYNIGISNEPTIHNGQWELLDRWSYQFHAPQNGDLISFVFPLDASKVFQKRIIATGGDTVTINNTQVVVNGVTLNEPYVVLQGNPNVNKYEHVTVPRDEFWVMGDDRKYSYDSRAWGFVPRKNILGRCTILLWPYAPNSGYVPDESDVFKGV